MLASEFINKTLDILKVSQLTTWLPIGRPSRAAIDAMLDRVTIIDKITRPV